MEQRVLEDFEFLRGTGATSGNGTTTVTNPHTLGAEDYLVKNGTGTPRSSTSSSPSRIGSKQSATRSVLGSHSPIFTQGTGGMPSPLLVNMMQQSFSSPGLSVALPHDEANVKSEMEIMSLVRKLQHDLHKKDEVNALQTNRIKQLEGELEKYNNLLTVVAELEQQLYTLKSQSNTRMLKTKIAEQDIVITGFRGIKLEYDELVRLLNHPPTHTRVADEKQSKRSALPKKEIPFHRFNDRLDYVKNAMETGISGTKKKRGSATSGAKKKESAVSEDELERVRHKLLAASYTEHGANIERLFKQIDHDHNGHIDMQELSGEIRRLVPSITKAKLDALMAIADEDGNGQMELNEFMSFIDHRNSLGKFKSLPSRLPFFLLRVLIFNH